MTDFAKTTSVADYTNDGGSGEAFDLYLPATGGAFPVLAWLLPPGEALPTTLTPTLGFPHLARAQGVGVVLATLTEAAGFQETKTPHSPEWGAVQLVQHLRLNAATLGISAPQIVLGGSGRAAHAAAWAGLGPDQRDLGGDPQEQQSSRPAAVLLRDVVARWQSLAQTLDDSTFGSGGPLSGVSTALQDANSPALYGDDAVNAAQPTFLWHTVATQAESIVPTYPDGVIESEASAWHGEVLEAVLLALDPVFHADPWNTQRWDASTEEDPDWQAEVAALDWLLYRAGLVPVEERRLRDVEGALRGITHAAGYATDVARVFRIEDAARNQGVYPSVMTASLTSFYDPEQFHTKHHNTTRMGLVLYLYGHQRQEMRVSQFLADVRRALMAKIGPASYLQLGGKVQRIHPDRSERWTDLRGESPRSGANVIVDVQWREKAGEPYQEPEEI